VAGRRLHGSTADIGDPVGSQSMSSTIRAVTSRLSVSWNRTSRSFHTRGENPLDREDHLDQG
jgi:hypothetical protein